MRRVFSTWRGVISKQTTLAATVTVLALFAFLPQARAQGVEPDVARAEEKRPERSELQPEQPKDPAAGERLSVAHGVNGPAAVDRLRAGAAPGPTRDALEAELLKDPALYLDANNEAFYVDAGPAEPDFIPASEVPTVREPGAESDLLAPASNFGFAFAPPVTDPVFSLASNPGADHTIYLDFDGHTTNGTSWNETDSDRNSIPFVNLPYDIDGSTETWSSTELARIRAAWEGIAEDYAPFDVNVTTIEPDLDHLSRSPGSGDSTWGVRVVFSTDTFLSCSCGGVAYVGAFDDVTDEPAFVFNNSITGMIEAGSHEVGHSMLLAHDGLKAGSDYYFGHAAEGPSWGPLMGAGYNRVATQWSKGEYYNASNIGPTANFGYGGDDLAVLSSMVNGNGFGYRIDDHADTAASTAVVVTGSYNGIISTTNDKDVFVVVTGGALTVNVTPHPDYPNLDVHLSVRAMDDSLIAESDDPSELSASLSLPSLPAGAYYIEIDGTGWGSPLTASPSGWTEYASLGQYTLALTADPDTVPPAPTANLGLNVTSPTRIDLSWDPNTEVDLAGYTVHRSLSSGGPYVQIDAVAAPGTVYADATVSAGTTYFYVVQAIDVAGNASTDSNEATGATPSTTTPVAPTGLVVSSAASEHVDLSWAANSETDLATYTVHRATNAGGPYTQLATVHAPDTTFTDTSVSPQQTYFYVVVAHNGLDSGLSNEATAVTPAVVIPPSAPSARWPSVGCTYTMSPASSAGFSDVPTGVFYDIPVSWAKENGITNGTSATTYSPEQLVNRAEMAAFLHRMVCTEAGSPAATFVDVSANVWFAPAVAWLKASAITAGTSATTYSPSDTVDRAQMATFLWRMAGSPGGSPSSQFSDVPKGEFYSPAIDWLLAMGITNGTSSTTYSPTKGVSRAEMAAFLYRLALIG